MEKENCNLAPVMEEENCNLAWKRDLEEFHLPGSSVIVQDESYSVPKRFMEDCARLQSRFESIFESSHRLSDYSAPVKRIRLEYDEIESNPSDDFKCHMLKRNPYEWQFGIRGASGIEFEGGIYHGRIQFPEEYPSKPPSFTLLTENGRFKTQNNIRIRRLNDWQPSWRVRDGLLALIDEMPTYPDGELGSVEYNKEERRDLAIQSRAAAPKYGTSERQKLIDEIHKDLLSKSPPVPVPPQHEHSQNDGAKRKHGTGGGGGSVVNNNFIIRNRIHATKSNRVGFLDSMNEAFNEGPNPKKPKLSWFWWRN